MEADWISILDIIKNGKFEASAISTYNAYLPFYEEVILRQLNSAGCRHNVLLMEAHQFNECLKKPDFRPQSAGYSYTIVPVSANRAFHPKIILLVARKKGLLFVGSHNITYSGFGLNKELTTRIDISDGSRTQGVHLGCSAWLFLRKWVDVQSSKLPYEIIESYLALSRFAPWLMKQTEPEDEGIQFFGSEPGGESLWTRISTEIREPIDSISIVGPFFDEQIEFLHKLQSDLKPIRFFVGIEPTTVSIPDFDHNKTAIKFVDASQLAKQSGYLHAKAVFIEAISGKSWLITGSANPSKPAWIAPPESRNAEAVIVHRGEIATETAKQIGINELDQMPEISSETWIEIKQRVGKEGKQKSNIKDKQNTFIGIATADGIKFSNTIFSQNDFVESICIDSDQKTVERCMDCELQGEFYFLRIQSALNKIRIVEIVLKDSTKLVCLVHHDAEISRRSVSSRQAQFRKTLSSLQTENPDLENLILTVEKIIFDEPFEVDPSAKRKIKANSKKIQEPEKTVTTLGIDIDQERLKKKRKRMVTSGDIGHLFDVLIHCLGIEIAPEISGVDKNGRTEEELVDSDDDEDEIERDNPLFILDAPKMVKICNNKVKRLITRMIKNFEKTTQENDGYDTCLMKLVAVLALLRELRSLDCRMEGIPFGESLFPMKERERLLKHSLMYLYGGKHKFLDQIDKDINETPWDELSRLHGLVFWLAYDCGADLTREKEFNESPEAKRKRIDDKSYLLLISPDAIGDSLAVEEAMVSIEKSTPKYKLSKGKKWLQVHSIIGNKLFKLKKRAHKVQCRIPNSPRVGHFAFIRDEINPTFHIVLETGQNVALSDICEVNGKRLYPTQKIASLPIPAL